MKERRLHVFSNIKGIISFLKMKYFSWNNLKYFFGSAWISPSIKLKKKFAA